MMFGLLCIMYYVGITVEFDRNQYLVYEHLQSLSVCIRINETIPQDNLVRPGVNLLLESTDITAKSPTDYSSVNDNVFFSAGSKTGAERCFIISITDDDDESGDRNFSLSLSNPQPLLDDIFIVQPNVTVTIADSFSPTITNPPQSFEAQFMSDAKLTCSARAQPPPTYTWFKNGSPLKGRTEEFLKFDLILPENRGLYSCSVANELGTVNSSEVILSIEGIFEYNIEVVFGRLSDEEIANLSNRIIEFFRTNVLDVAGQTNGTFIRTTTANSTGDAPITTEEIPSSVRRRKRSVEGKSSELLRTTILVNGQVTSAIITEYLNNNTEFMSFNLSNFTVTRFDGCPAEIVPLNYIDSEGNITGSVDIHWDESDIGLVTMRCPCGNLSETLNLTITRFCDGDFINQAEWDAPIVDECAQLNFNICSISTLPPPESSDMLNSFIQTEEFTPAILNLTSFLFDTLTVSAAVDNVTQNNYLDSFSGIASMSREVIAESGSSFRFISSLERFTTLLPLGEADNDTDEVNSITLSRDNFAIFVEENEVIDDSFLTSTISAVPSESRITFVTDMSAAPSSLDMVTSSLATVTLTPSVFEAVLETTNGTTSLRTNTIVYDASSPLFQDNSTNGTGSSILSVRITPGNAPSNLMNPVTFIFLNTETLNVSNNDSARCVFWDPILSRWSGEGCNFAGVEANGTLSRCSCDHLTSFTVLLDINQPDTGELKSVQGQALRVFSYAGGILSTVFLTITVITYLISHKLRSGVHGQVLIHMCFSLIGLYITFLLSSVVGSEYGKINGRTQLCLTFSALLHYFFLVYFCLTVGQSVLLYLKLVKVLGTAVFLNYFHIKIGLISWIIPLFIVAFFFAPTHDLYIRVLEGSSKAICFPRSWPFYFGVITPFAVIYAFNLVIFLIIMFKVLRHGNNKDTKVSKTKKLGKRAMITIVLLVMFGIGWIFGILGGVTDIQPISIPFQVLFIATAGFHGVLLFLLHPVRSKDAREEWKKWLYYLTCRREEYNMLLSRARKQSAVRTSEQSSNARRISQQTTLSTSASNMAERFGYRRTSQDSTSNLSIRPSRLSHSIIAEETSLYSVAEEIYSPSDNTDEAAQGHSTRPGLYVFNKDDELLTFGNEAAFSDWFDSDMDNCDLTFSRSPSAILLNKISKSDNGSRSDNDYGILSDDDDELAVHYNFEDDDM